MLRERDRENVCEVVGVFHTAEDLEAAIEDLLKSGFDRAQLGLLASERAIEDKLKHRYRRVAELAEHSDALGELRRQARRGPITLLYAAKDKDHSHAIVLRKVLLEGMTSARACSHDR